MTSPISRITSVLAKSLFLLLVAAPAAWAGAEWVSMDVGHRWIYEIDEQTHVSAPPGTGRPDKDRARTGQLVTEIEGTQPEDISGTTPNDSVLYWARAETTWTRGDIDSGDASDISKTERTIENGAVVDYDYHDDGGRTRSVLLPAKIEANTPWLVGDFEAEGFAFRLEGVVEGVQKAETRAGVFDRCLRVRYWGTMTSLEPAPEGPQAIVPEPGRIEFTVWYARGVGEVLIKRTMTMEMATPMGTASSRFEQQLSLVEFSQGGSAPASR